MLEGIGHWILSPGSVSNLLKYVLPQEKLVKMKAGIVVICASVSLWSHCVFTRAFLKVFFLLYLQNKDLLLIVYVYEKNQH